MGAQTVDEFLLAHKISRSLFYDQCRKNKGPALMYVGSKTLISDEASAQWRREREEEAKAAGSQGRGLRKTQTAVVMIAVFLACFQNFRPFLGPGEKAVVMIVAADRKQARSA